MTSDVLSRPAPPPDLVVAYGSGPEHVADVRLPPSLAGPAPDGAAGPAPLVIFLHGGFWRSAFDRVHTGPLATALAAAGFAVCVPEYRRTGQPGGGWPGTFDDVATAVDVLPSRVREAVGTGLISDEVLLAGHSAGGHLALWAASRHQLPPGSAWRAPPGPERNVVPPALAASDAVPPDAAPRGVVARGVAPRGVPPALAASDAVPPDAVARGVVARGVVARGVVALAAVTDMPACHALGLGQGAAQALLGGAPDQYPDRYRLVDPMRLLPAGCPVRLVHGSADDRVPFGMSRDYAARARASGDDAVLDELPDAGHFDIIDPLSPWWPRVLAAFAAVAQP